MMDHASLVLWLFNITITLNKIRTGTKAAGTSYEQKPYAGTNQATETASLQLYFP